MEQIDLAPGSKAYFASDFHLGMPDKQSSREREATIIEWLTHIQNDAGHIFLMGDLFDFWFEYRHVVPKGFVRFLGKIAELTDSGIPVWFFVGNHDMWVRDYFQQELGVRVFFDPISVVVGNLRLHIGHGDGLGPGDKTYKVLKIFFRSIWCRRLFGALHPSWGIRLAQFFSRQSKLRHEKKGDFAFKGPQGEWLWHYCQHIETQTHHDGYVFGHRHLPLDLVLPSQSRYLNCGEWMSARSYVVCDGKMLELKFFR